MCVSQPLKQDPQNIKPHAKVIAKVIVKVITKAKSHHRLLNFSAFRAFVASPKALFMGYW